MTESCLLFVHIPKTAGQTVEAALRWRYRNSPGAVLHYSALTEPLEEVERIPLEDRARARVIGGPFYYGLHRYIPQRCNYATILREPVARVVSLYNYVRRTKDHPLHVKVVDSDISLAEFVGDRIGTGVENGQTKQLAGHWQGEANEQTLATATSNLAGFLVVGLMEQFPESMALLWRALGWGLPVYQSRNVTRTPPPPIPDETVALIRERNTLDMALYDHGHYLFEMSTSKQPRGFRRRVWLSRVTNRVANIARSRS